MLVSDMKRGMMLTTSSVHAVCSLARVQPCQLLLVSWYCMAATSLASVSAALDQETGAGVVLQPQAQHPWTGIHTVLSWLRISWWYLEAAAWLMTITWQTCSGSRSLPMAAGLGVAPKAILLI
jgi:hypothetical protein